MDVPRWWEERPYGLLIHTSAAAVPAWAPIGMSADRYRTHLGGSTRGARSDGTESEADDERPMVEVLAYHRDRWGHIERYDDFVPLLTFKQFDAEAWAQLAADAGCGFGAIVAKHHDGWAWWDAPATDRTMFANGPRHDVVADFAAACERNDLVFGAFFTVTATTDEPADATRVQVTDLVDRVGARFLIVDDADPSRSTRISTSGLDVLVEADDVDVDPGSATPRVRVLDEMPSSIRTEPWLLRRSVGPGHGLNRAARPEHHLSAHDIICLLTEVIAKGGHLLLGVGPSADGTINDLQSQPLRDAGVWIRHHDRLLSAARPWAVWGDDDVRYFAADDAVHAVDLHGRGRFRALPSSAYRVDSVEEDGRPIAFQQDADGLQLDTVRPAFVRREHRPGPTGIHVYRVQLVPVEAPAGLFADEPRPPVHLEPLLRDAAAGDIVQLGDGRYVGPVTVPAHVTLRGLGTGRTVIDGDVGSTVVLEQSARVEHLRIAGGNGDALEVRGPFATVLGCSVDGRVRVRSASVLVRATRARQIMGDRAERLSISRCEVLGDGGDVGIHVIGGEGHDIDSCDVHGHRCAIRVTETTNTVVRGNNISARRTGVHLERTEGAHVHGNFVNHTTRGVDIDAGRHAEIDGNAVCDGDSGCIVQSGAADCRVNGNRWERCRIGVLAWESTDLVLSANESIDLHEPDAAERFGP